MKRTISLRHSLACAVSAAILLNTVPVLADDISTGGGTVNQTTPVDSTQRDHNISQPNAFGDDPSDSIERQENRTTSTDSAYPNEDTTSSQPGIAGDDLNQSIGDARRGALVNNTDGGQQVQLSTGDNQLQPVVARSLVDRKVVNLQNKPIGEVEEVIQGPNGVAALVVEAGGFMGIGEKEVMIPLDQIRLSDNQLIWESQMDVQQLKDSQEYRYEENRYSTISDD